jgi:hypothetical protein
MTPREIRHNRIIELRTMALQGATMAQLKARCEQMKICSATGKSYLHEIVQSIQKKHITSISQ